MPISFFQFPSRRRRTVSRLPSIHVRLHFERLEVRALLSATPLTDTLSNLASETADSLSSSILGSQSPSSNASHSVIGPAATHSVDRYAIVGEDLSQAESALEEMGITKIKSFKHFGGLAVNLTEAEAEALSAVLDHDLRLVSDAPYKAFHDGGVAGGGQGGGGPSGDLPQQTPWGINAINAPAAWSVTRGAGVAVCILDTGVDQDHPDLNISVGANYIDGGSWDDDNGHGTHVAGTVAAIDNTIGDALSLFGSDFINIQSMSADTRTLVGERGSSALSTREAWALFLDRPLVVTTGVSGDFNGNAELDIEDLDLLASELQSERNVELFDVNSDNVVDFADRQFWVRNLANTFFGDANLDQQVNFADFLALSGGFEKEGGWAQGDFDGDGQTKFEDFLMLADNFGKTASSGEAASVPEPSSVWLLSIGAIGVLRRRKSSQLAVRGRQPGRSRQANLA